MEYQLGDGPDWGGGTVFSERDAMPMMPASSSMANNVANQRLRNRNSIVGKSLASGPSRNDI